MQEAAKPDTFAIFVGLSVVAGTGLGLLLRMVWDHEQYVKINYLEFPGRVMINFLKMLSLPLIVSSLVTGVSKMEIGDAGVLALSVCLYNLTTTIAAAAFGIALALFFLPDGGDLSNLDGSSNVSINVNTTSIATGLVDILSQWFPNNSVVAFFETPSIIEITKTSDREVNHTDNSTYTVEHVLPVVASKPVPNVAGLIAISVFLGFVISSMETEAAPVKTLFYSLNLVILHILDIVVWYTPVGITFLLASKIISLKYISKAIVTTAKFFLVFFLGLFLYSTLVLTLVYYICVGRNPLILAINVTKALFVALTSSSSIATLPITMECLINNQKISINIARVVVPISMLMNKNGTAFYLALTTVFISHSTGLHLSLTDILVIGMMSTVYSIGSTTRPQHKLEVLVMVLTAVNITSEDALWILSLDWIMDRMCTVVNVWGDCVGSSILSQYYAGMFIEPSTKPLSSVTKRSTMTSSESAVRNRTSDVKEVSEPGNEQLIEINSMIRSRSPSIKSELSEAESSISSGSSSDEDI